MRSLLLLLIVVAGGWLGYVGWSADAPTYSAPSDRAPDELSGDVPAGYVVRRFSVEGMCCEGCPKKLFHRLEAMEGVNEAAADLETASVSVVVAESVPVESIVAVLASEPKYTVRALP